MDGTIVPMSASGTSFSNSEKNLDVMFFCVTAFASIFKFSGAINKIKQASLSAAGKQGQGIYQGIDNWTDVTIKKGSYVWGGTPGQSNFYTTSADMMNAGNDATKIFQGLQVGLPNGFSTYRPGMTLYKVPYDMNIAISQALANPQHGAGGFTQLFIPNYQDLEPVYSLILINR